MNLVILVGTVVTEVEFKFIYDRYKDCLLYTSIGSLLQSLKKKLVMYCYKKIILI